MKAAILRALNEPLVIGDLSLPGLDTGQVCVQVKASGICGKQLGEIAGDYGPDKHLPHLLGHEGAGVVINTGPGVLSVKQGDHVVLHWRKGAGLEGAFPKYQWETEFVGGGHVTTFNEYAVVSENRITKIDADVPFDIAALMGCAVTTGLGVVINDAKLVIGQSIAVIGCGGVGLNIIQGAKLAGAESIVAIDILPEKQYKAEQFGATEAWDDPKYMDGVDVIVDTTGIASLIAEAYDLIAPGGKVIMVGQPRRGVSLELRDIAKNMKGKTLVDSEGGGTRPNVDIPLYLDFWKKGLLNLESLITHRFHLQYVNEALDAVRSGRAGRVILEMP